MERQRAIVRNGPRRGGPDDRRYITGDFCSFAFTTADYLKFHPDRRADMVFVLHLGFGERRGIDKAPIHRLTSTVYVAFFHKVQEGIGNGGLISEAHGEVGIVPASKNAQAFEIAFVLLDIAGSEFAAES